MPPGFSAALWTCVLAAASGAQNGPAFRSRVEVVVVPLTVVDANGVATAGLTRDDFQVYDNDVRRPIESFWVDNDVPLTLGVIVDASESQKELIPEHRRTAVDLLERILRPGDRAFVVSVEEKVRLWVDLTGTAAEVRRGMAGTPVELLGQACGQSVCGSTPLWDAVSDAASLKLRSLTGTKALLLLTDGFDSGSARTWQQAADAANKADAGIYAIQYPSAFGRNYAPDLYRLVADAGGPWFQAREGIDEAVVARMEADLRHRYVLGFRPERLSGKVRHNIRVEATRPDLNVRARKTYFQEPN